MFSAVALESVVFGPEQAASTARIHDRESRITTGYSAGVLLRDTAAMRDILRRGLRAIVLVACAACGAVSSNPESLLCWPGPDWSEVGVQVWNGTRTEFVVSVLARERGGRVRVLAERIVVPPHSGTVDPSLGDDPNRARIVGTWLEPGEWEIEVAVGDRSARHAVPVGGARWVIADVGASQLVLSSADGPRRLE
jgi:hypothetical protein